MGGYGIVGGNLPIAAGLALARRLPGDRGRDAVHVRRRRLQPGHVRRDAQPRRAVEAAGRLHGHQQPVRHGHRARAPLGRHRPARKRGEGFGVPGMRCDGMDVARHLRGHDARRSRSAREERRPVLVEAITYRFRGHSMADPEEYRTKEQVERVARARPARRPSRDRLVDEGVLDEDEREQHRRGGGRARRRGRRVRRRARPHPGARVAVRRRLRARRPGPRLVLARRARGRACTAARTSATARTAPRASSSRRVVDADAASAGDAERAATSGERPPRRRRGRRADGRDALPRGAATRPCARRCSRDERVFLMGEDIGVFSGAFKVTAGPARGVRREARARHADLREHDRRRRRRRRDGRAAAGRRADDGQLLAAGDGPDRQLRPRTSTTCSAARSRCRSSCACPRAPATSSARRTRTASRRCSCTSPGLLVAVPATPGRREGPAQGGDPRRQPGRLHRARVPLRPARRGPRRRATTSSTSARPRSAARART